MKRFISMLRACMDYLSSAFAYVATSFVLIMMLLVTFEVTSRSLFGFSTLVAGEVAGYLLVGIVFLGLAYCLKTGGHIYVEFIVARVSPAIREVMRLTACTVAATCTSLITYLSYNLTLDSYKLGAKSYALSQAPIYLPQMIVPIGMGLFTVQLIVEGFKAVRSLQKAWARKEREPHLDKK